VRVAFGARTCSTTRTWLSIQVGVCVLAMQIHVSDPDQRPVRLVHLLLYEAAQFLDKFGQMSQTGVSDARGTPLHSFLQHVSESIQFNYIVKVA